MKWARRSSALAASILGTVISIGSIGSLQSAFELPVAKSGLGLLCIITVSFFYAALLHRKHGSLVFTCLMALSAGFLFREGTASQQFGDLLYGITATYDRAYHWGVWYSHTSGGYTDLPLGIAGSAIAMTVVFVICRRKKVWPAVLAALLPLAACVVVTDTVPKEGYLFCLMAGLVLLILPSSVRRESMPQSLRLTVMLTSPVVLALAWLFWSIPQAGYVDQSALVRENILTIATHLPQLAEQGIENTLSQVQGTMATQVDLSALGPRIPFSYPVMDITAEKSGHLYLRGQDFDCYNGLSWESTAGRQEIFSLPEGKGQTITIHTRSGMDARYLPYYPQEVTTLTGGFAKNPEKSHNYTIACGNLSANQLSHAEDTADWDHYLSLPEHTQGGAIQFLSGALNPQASNTQKAEAIAALVKNSAVYSLSPGYMPSYEEDFALWFLNAADKGYCVHFATAATVLLRAAGVPARYVTGYLAKTIAGETVTITQADAHAWAEYYEPQVQCWIPLEATPAAIAPQESVQTTLPAETDAAATEVLSKQTSEIQIPEISPVPAAQPEEKQPPGRSGWLLLILLPMLELQRSIRMDLRRRRQRKATPLQKALLRWQEAQRLSRLLKETPAEDLHHLAEKAKFSQHSLTIEEIQRFDSFNRSCLRRLKEKPWYLRLAYRYGYAVY